MKQDFISNTVTSPDGMWNFRLLDLPQENVDEKANK